VMYLSSLNPRAGHSLIETSMPVGLLSAHCGSMSYGRCCPRGKRIDNSRCVSELLTWKFSNDVVMNE